MDWFRMALDHCSLRDLGFLGPQFTWHKLFMDGRSIRSKLDRALVSSSWLGKFSNAILYHISNSASNHCILSLRLGLVRVPFKGQSKQFRFEAMWLRDPKCQDVVSEAWERGLMSSLGCPLSNCLQACQEDLTGWNKKEFRHVGRRIAQLQTKLQTVEASGTATSEEIRSARSDLKLWLDAKETMWKQWSHNT
ncbi:uncharacterized protein LOC115991253 [Quercus lobata]|uniref:uncharacterized protein LOC115991253 n=1 Tax=Quercus lobata TaxID=97700 RepID=UPI001248DDB3|nr:uncharacterized protein LOC115991253 [Quercus lobata]